MSKTSILLLSCVLVLCLAGVTFGDLIGHWKFDEGSGAVASDSSGKGHHGQILGTPTWATGPGGRGSALAFNPCGGVDCGVFDPTNGKGKFSIALWAFWDGTGDFQHFFTKSTTYGATTMMFQVELWGAHTNATYTDRVGVSYQAAGSVPFDIIPKKEWVHLAFVFDGTNLRCYLNGVDKQGPKAFSIGPDVTSSVFIGVYGDRVQRIFHGVMDDFRLYDHPLTAAEVKAALSGSAKQAANPNPADKAVDVPQDASFSWTAGELAETHDVYLGKTFADVNTATRASTPLLVSQGQKDTSYRPAALLDFGQTYYWRIDEVNKAPDNTLFKGNVWSFTTESYGYPVKPVKATAASAQTGMGPEKTIDGSGLTGDLHGVEATTMWLSAGAQPNWIQYEFDKVYKLHQFVVWNSNQLVEAFLGFSAKKVTIETSVDGTTWTAVPNVPEFSKAPGAPGYAANTTVNLGSVDAKFVKLTITANWGGVAPQSGLAEVRFFYAPMQARAPQPATAATGVSLDATLDWRPGREATSHKLFFGMNQDAVAQGTAPAKTLTNHGFTPDALNYGTQYYWKVDEVGTATYPGEVWNFTTLEYGIVDDFESYTDKQGAEVFTAWADGMVNSNGSIVGLYPDAVNGTFCERVIIHGGKQSMPFEYNNVKAPYYSEAERTFDTPQDWTGHGADTLSLFWRGYPVGFADKGNNTFTVTSAGTDIWGTVDQFRFVFKQLSGNGTLVAKVDSIGNTDPWAKGGVMIRESLEPGARFAAVYATPGNGVRYQARLTTAGSATSDTAVVTPTQTALKTPVWVKIERTGSTFNGYYSADGAKWTAMSWNPQTINMAANPVYIGLAVTSHNATAYSTAELSNVATTGAVTGAWQDVSIGVTQQANSPAPLYVTVEDKAGKKKTAVNLNPAATAVAAWTQWRIPLSELTGVNLAAVKKLTLGAGDRTNPKPGGAGKLYFDDIGFGHPVK